MIWKICFIISITILFLTTVGAISAKRRNRCGQMLNPFNTIFAGVFLAVFVGLVPMFASILAEESAYVLKLILFDALQTIQVFTVNVGADLILDNINSSATAISDVYSTYMTCLFFIAPILTFGFLISLLKNALASVLYALNFGKDVFAFSTLNEKSLMLAQDLKKNHRRALIVFTNVDRDEGDVISEHIETAKALGALLFRKDIVTVNFAHHSKKAGITFFTIDDKEGDNLIQSLKLLSKYNWRDNTGLYVFSTGAEGELLLSNAPKGKVKVRRINEVRSLVYHYLYDEGNELFENAKAKDGKLKAINAVVVGLGKYGTEMMKALPWFCQMDGYSVTIHAFDKDFLAKEKFYASCPELMGEKYNGVSIEGESQYSIYIHSGVDADTKSFADLLKSIPDITFVFVCLGDDEENINHAANIRMLCERAGSKPIIKTVVYSTEEKEALEGITNYRGQQYGIDAIGDLETSCSEEVLMGSELEKLALERHLKWGKEEEFWQYEYNYRSSMASAIHMKARVSCGIIGAGKNEGELTAMERETIEQLEHRRWNTYMRSEGYVYSGSPEKASRNDLAKMHHDLVDFDSLTEEEKRKDSSVGSL